SHGVVARRSEWSLFAGTDVKVKILVLVAILSASLLRGQFSNLVAPGDGRALYFSSNLPLLPLHSGYLDPGQPPQRWILTVGTEPLSEVAGTHTVGMPDLPPKSSETVQYVSDYYIFDRYDVSSDGAVVAITSKRACIGGSACFSVPLYQTTVHVGGNSDRAFPCEGWLSRNGRYLLCGWASQLGPPLLLFDLVTGAQTTYGSGGAGPFTTVGRAVADNGTLLTDQFLVQNGRSTQLPGIGYAREEAVIDAAGKVILYSARQYALNGRRHLRIYRVPDNQDSVFLQGNGDL